jgi:hypothetical protein
MARKKTARSSSRKTAVKTKAARKKKSAATKRPARRSAVKAKPAAAPPKPPAKAELIVRQGFIIDATGKQQHAVPEVLLLGNREGLQYLADAFAHLAEQAKARSRTTDPGEPIHLIQLDHPVNPRLSDAVAFRFIPLTTANRAATFKQHGVTMKSREHGSLFERYQDVAQTQYGSVLRQLEWERRHRSGKGSPK